MKIEETSKIYKLIGFFLNLTENSEEYEFTLALRSLKTLKAKSRTSELTREIVILAHKDFSGCFNNWFTSPKIGEHAFHLGFWLGLLYFDLVEGKDKRDAAFNVMSAIGLLLMQYENGSSQEYPSDYIQEILPNIDEMCELILVATSEHRNSQNFQQMNALFKAFRLNPVQANGDAFVDRLCTLYVSDISAEPNHFLTLKEIELSDERGVHLTAFMTFFQNFVANPDSAKLPYLKEYFAFLKSMKYLSKTELFFIENLIAQHNS